jgi:peroxiredoxin family protein
VSNGLSAVVISDTYEKVHYALVLASAAAAIGKPSLLFFSMGACRALATHRQGPSAANPAEPGWHDLTPSVAFPSARDQDAGLGARGIADMETLLTSCAALGTRFLVCEAGLRALDLGADDLRPDLAIEVTGAVTWMTETPPDAMTLMA